MGVGDIVEHKDKESKSGRMLLFIPIQQLTNTMFEN